MDYLSAVASLLTALLSQSMHFLCTCVGLPLPVCGQAQGVHSPLTVPASQSWSDLQVLTDATSSPLKKAEHKYAIQRELDAVMKLRGALNIAAFEDAYEDDENVYIITEICRGGELWHRVGDKHYSERTVSSCRHCYECLLDGVESAQPKPCRCHIFCLGCLSIALLGTLLAFGAK